MWHCSQDRALLLEVNCVIFLHASIRHLRNSPAISSIEEKLPAVPFSHRQLTKLARQPGPQRKGISFKEEGETMVCRWPPQEFFLLVSWQSGPAPCQHECRSQMTARKCVTAPARFISTPQSPPVPATASLSRKRPCLPHWLSGSALL